MRYTGPKAKKARRLGMAFTEKDAKVLQKRGFPPGQHGQNRVRMSEYGLQLREKQKAKISYGTQEKQFRRYFKKALTQPGVTGDNLFKLLEMRLDNVVFRLGFAQTRAQGRQLVSHGFFEVDGKKVNIPSFSLKVGSQISVRQNKQKSSYMERIKEKLKSFKPSEWLELKADVFAGKVLGQPTPEMIDSRINAQLIVEHYSRI